MSEELTPPEDKLVFKAFSKIARLSRDCIITEKIDGTNAQIAITEDGQMFTGSRNRWITPQNDNYGFARWCEQNKEELLKLGPGRHFGEWWGCGIQRKYDLSERRFSLFGRIKALEVPKCVTIVPTLYEGLFDTMIIQGVIENLRLGGSQAAPGFMKPEGIVIFHKASGTLFKKTLENDEQPKGLVKES
jgi:hypothetical protein